MGGAAKPISGGDLTKFWQYVAAKDDEALKLKGQKAE